MDALFNILMLVAGIAGAILFFAGAQRICAEVEQHWHARRLRARARREVGR